MAPTDPLTREQFLDTWVNPFTVSTFLDHLGDRVRVGGRWLVVNHNMNSLALLTRNRRMRELYDRADANFIDGMPVVWLARLLGAQVEAEHRIGVLDWVWPFAARAESEGWKVVHVGGTDELMAGARDALLREHPGLDLVLLSGYFDQRPASPENRAVLDRIRREEPDVILVGMGMPRQEEWLWGNLEDLPACPIITVGGILGFIGGVRKTAPRWMGRLGVEWLYRLATEPSRLWRRYLVEPLALVGPVVRGLWKRHRRSG